jgi:hypothetical protein
MRQARSQIGRPELEQAGLCGVRGICWHCDRGRQQYDQRLKSLQLAVSAQSAGDKAAYNKNYANYLIGKLQVDKDKATAEAKGGKSWNKPDSQKFIDAQNALAKDPDFRASQKMLEGVIAGGNGPINQPRIAQAQAAHTALVQQKQAMYLSGVGLNPAQIQANIQNPPGTPAKSPCRHQQG